MANRKRADQADRGAAKRARTKPDGVQLDQLPYLCLRKIFSFLKLRDLANCWAVNRLFKSYADQVQVDELVVEVPNRWPGLFEPLRPFVDSESTITWKQFRSAMPLLMF